jgi:hypothetical protein
MSLSRSLNQYFHVATIAILALVGMVLSGCGLFPEASFSLAPESRLPKWFTVPQGQTRETVTVTMDYHVSPLGRTATFSFQDLSGRVIATATGRQLGLEPLHRKTKQSGYPDGYPSYEVINVDGTIEIIEHRQMEPIFYVTDDPDVRAELASHG